MNLPLWIKALHLTAAVLFTSGLLMMSLPVLLCRVVEGPAWPQERRLLLSTLAWNRRVVAPSLLLLWGAGLALAHLQGVFGAGWLNAKLVLVLSLSALHGLLSGRLRRLAAGPGAPQGGPLRFVAPGVVATVFLIVVLAVGKPF